MTESDTESSPWWKPALTVFSQVSGWIVVPLVLALIVGKNLDARFDTEPWLFIGATCVGFAISTFGIVRTTFAYM
ncbi:MAG: AtpZ/AtpI family protein, partial [bacterium]|nr:AtpZ/AtpI family protein [bacterium]